MRDERNEPSDDGDVGHLNRGGELSPKGATNVLVTGRGNLTRLWYRFHCPSFGYA